MCACVCPPTMSYSHPPPNVTPRLYLQHTAMPVRFYLTLFMGSCVCKQQMCRQSHAHCGIRAAQCYSLNVLKCLCSRLFSPCDF